MRKFICLLLCLTMVLSACTFAKADLFDDLGGLFSNLGDMAGDLWGDAAEWAENKFGEASEWSEEAFGNVTEWAENAYGDVSEWAENAFGDVKEWSEDAIHTTGDFLSTVWGDVSDTAGDAWDWVLQTTDHFTETFADSFEAVDQWISMTGDNVTEFLKKQLYELMEKTGLDEAQAESVFGKLLAYAEEHNIPADKMIKLVLPYAVQLSFRFGDNLPELTDAAGVVNADAVSDFLISALTNMKVDSEEAADEALEELEEELEELSETDAD